MDSTRQEFPRLASPAAGLQPIDDWHICISGFRQPPGYPSGIQTVWSRLRRAHNNGRVAVEYWEWCAAWDQVAELIWNFRRPGHVPRVFIYAYSWGGGWGFTRLARALQKRGIEVPTAVLCDPVYCSPLWVGWFAAFLSWKTIRVPANVKRVLHFFQRQNWPRGHRPVAVDPSATLVEPGRELRLEHHYMDDAEEFQSLCVDVAKKASSDLH
ncbi:MAG: hypothetical protein AB7O62_00265 [Pirellulales bacterium]